MATSGDQFDPTSLARELNTSLSLADASPVKPDDEAKLREVSKRLGIPLDSARTDPQAAIKAGEQDAFDLVKFAERFPSTAKHLANVDNALISNDDRDPLASVEDAVRKVGTSTVNLGRSVGAAPFDVSSALYGLLESTFALGSQMVGRPLAENRILPEDVFARGRQFFEQQRKAGAKIADNIAPAGGSMGFVETAVNQGIRSFAQQAPGLAASVLTGNPAFTLGMAGVQSGSTSTTKALDKGLTPVQALAYGAADAVIEIGTEKIPVSAFINDMKVGSGFFKTLIKNQLTEQPSEQVATALQDFNEWATLRPDATIADYISERPEAAAQTAIATLAGGVVQTSVFKGVQAVAERANGRQQEANTATAVAQRLDEVMAAAATSQTRVRDPQTFAQMVQDAAESSGTAPTELFIDAQPLLAIIEQAGITPEQLTQMLPSVAEQIEEAIATDGTLTIPVGEATAAFAGSGFEQELVRNARTSVNGISAADAEQAGATVEALGAEAQQIIAEQQDKDAWEMSAKVVFDKVAAQLNTAGRFTPEVNRAYATVARDYYAVQAAKMGITPEQLYAQFPITTDARLPGGSDVLRRAGVLDQSADPRDLFVGHNISAEGVRQALALGGLAAPSLGISRTTTGGFDGYGEITLLAPKDIIESSGARTFNSDVYSPRQPRPVYNINVKKLNDFATKADAMPMARNRGARRLDQTEVERYGAEALARVDGVQMLYLDEIGELPKPKPKKVEPVIKKAAKLPYADRSYTLRDDPKFIALAKEHYEEQLAAIAEADPSRVDRYRNIFFDEDGSVNLDSRDRLAREVSSHVESGGMDFPAFRDAIAKKLRSKAQSEAFSRWLEKQADGFVIGKQIKISPSRKIPYTLDNVVAQMTKELRGGEGFNYGAGNIRAMNAAEIGSVREVQNRREEIVSGEDFKRVKEESQQRLTDTLDALSKFYKFDADSWGYINDASSALAEGPKGWRTAFRITTESEKIIRDYISYVKNLPTEYFEIKMQRAVAFNEFKTAVVAKGTPQDVVDALTNAGLEIKTYDANKPGARAKAISGAKDLLFQSTTLPDTIEVDGKTRPTTDNTGKPLAQTEEGVRNFWRWFGDSKVVDDDGRPLVVYHGTRKKFNVFAPSKPRGALGNPQGVYFSPDKSTAREYAEDSDGATDDQSRVVEAYIKIESANDGLVKESRYSGVEYIVFNPTQIKSATGNSGEFDPTNPSIVAQQESAPRATFDPASLNIALLEKADLSSYLHELGHAFFEISAHLAARPDAPQAIRDDIQTLFNTTGYTGTVQEWLATPVSQRRIAHETIAESFEQYLLEGKAPTLEQQALFAKLRSWMVSVYRTLADFLSRNGNANLTAEVRSVFDRMLANDEAIAATKAARGATPLFTSAEQAGMTPEQFAEYQAATGEIDEDAVRELDSRSLRDLKWLRTARSRKIKELQADATAKRRNARIEARRQLLNEPVYRALTFLRGKVEPVPVEKRSGKKLDTRRDDIETAIAKLGGLNREEVMRQFGVDRVSFPTKIVGFPTLRAGGAGKSIDAMGEALAEMGYLRYDENGKYDLAELEEKLLDQDRGISHYSMEADWDLINGYKMLPAPEDADTLAISAGRLSLPELEERLGNTDIDFGKLGIGRRGMIQQMGMPMDVIAELTGFKSGEDMVRALVDAEPLQAATEGLTDRIMLERYGDLSSPEAIERAADQALASEARTRMVATELSRLNTSVGSSRVVATVAKQTAQQVVARQKIRNVRPDKTAGAQARAGKGAEAAFRKGDIETAAGFKRSQVLNAAIEREQRQTRVEIDKARDNFSAMFGNDKRAGKTRDMNLVNAARAMVAQYGLAPEVAGQRATDYQSLLREYNPAMADNIQALFDTLPDPKDYRELTVEEFRGMRDAVLGIYQMSRRVMQTRIDGKLVEQDEVATVLVEAVLKRNGGELPGLLGYDSTITDAQKRKVNLLGLKAVGTRVEQWSDAMGAEVKRVIYQQVSDAAVQARLKRTELIAAYKQLLDGVAGGITYDKIVAPELGGFEFTRGKTELLHAILHTGNESNKRKLLLGRRWAELDAEGNLDSTRWDSFVSRMVQQGVLTEADFDFAQGVWDLLETVKADAQKAHFDIFGYYFNEVTANTFIDPFGIERRGGYVPALVTVLSAADQAQKREAEAAQQGGNSYMFPTTGKGFTNSRVEYNRPLELDLRTIGSHLDKVARFAFLEPAINDTGRLLQNKRVARALNGLDTNIISKMLNPWLQRAATQTTTVPTRFPQADKFFRGLRTRSGMYIMFANVINTMQQITGFSVAAVKVPAPKMLRALKAYTGNPGELARMTAELSAFMRDRLDNQGFEMTQQIEEILTNPTVLDKAGDFMKRNAYFMQTGLQNVMDVVVWQAAYDHARGMSGVSDKQAIRYADETIRTTQGTFAPEAVSGIEVQPAFIQLFTQFWGYFNMLANTLGGEAGKAVREMGYMASTPRLLMIWFAGLAIPAVVGQMIAQGIPDDDDDEDGDGTLDEWLAMFFGSQASTLAAMVPVWGQVSMLVANQFDNKIYNDRLNLSPAVSMIDSAAGGAKAVLQGTAFDDRLTKKEVRDVAIAVALATGAPTNVIAKPVGYVLDVEAGKKEPDNAAEYGIGLLTGR